MLSRSNYSPCTDLCIRTLLYNPQSNGMYTKIQNMYASKSHYALYVHCTLAHCTLSPLLHNFALLLHSSPSLQLQLHYAAHSLSWPQRLAKPQPARTSGALRQSNTSEGKKDGG